MKDSCHVDIVIQFEFIHINDLLYLLSRLTSQKINWQVSFDKNDFLKSAKSQIITRLFRIIEPMIFFT